MSSNLNLYLDNALKKVQMFEPVDNFTNTDYDIEMEVSNLIIHTRTQLGMTQKELAEKSGVSQSNISKIENGSYRPSIYVLKKIANGLGKRLIIDFSERGEML